MKGGIWAQFYCAALNLGEGPISAAETADAMLRQYDIRFVHGHERCQVKSKRGVQCSYTKHPQHVPCTWTEEKPPARSAKTVKNQST